MLSASPHSMCYGGWKLLASVRSGGALPALLFMHVLELGWILGRKSFGDAVILGLKSVFH